MSDKVPFFEINGREYDWPGVVGLSVREARIFYQETGMVWESLWLDGLTVRDLFMREGFLSAMARIAYVREHPEALDDEVKAIIDRQPRMSLFSTLLQAFDDDTEDGDAEGKAEAAESGETNSSQTRNEPGSTPNGESSKPETSGNGSTPSSAQPGGSPDCTGTGESAGRSTSPPLRSVI